MMPRRAKGERALRLLRRYMPRLRWCPSCGIPVLGAERCPRCGGRTLEVKLVPPGDARPAWEGEKRETIRAAERDMGREAARRLLGDESALWLFNPVQAVDAADEVIVDGHTVATRLYDPVEARWRVRPDRVGVEILVGEEIGPYAVVDEKLRPGILVEPRRSSGVSWRRGEWVALAGRGLSYGVGKVIGRGKLRVVKAWYRRRRIEWRHRPRGISVEEVAEANRGWLLGREEEAVKWLQSMMREHGGRWLAGLSGGKDSSVSAAIAAKAGVEEAYTIDTGVEHPESLETVDALARALGLRLHRAEAGDAFWRGLEAYGPPARDYRWCTRLIKLAPLSRLFRSIASPGERVVMVTGQRGAESPQRAASPRLAESGTVGKAKGYLVASPIQEWSSLEVFLYITLRRLPLNPLYRLGFERIGCYMCPASHLAEFRIVERRHPDLWGRWMNYLLGYARKARLPREWATMGFWRWRLSLPSEAKLLARRLNLNPGQLIRGAATPLITLNKEGPCLRFSPRKPKPAPGPLEGWLRAAGLEPSGTGSHVHAYLPGGGRLDLDAERGEARLCGAEPRHQLPALRASFASLLCLRCGLCMEACGEGAIREAGVVDPLRCTGCRACLGVCPSSVLADLLASITRSPRRQGKGGA